MDDSINIAFMGDLMPGGVLHYQSEFIDEDILKYLSTFDLRIATLETAIGDNFTYDNEKMKGRKNIIYSKDSDLSKIIDLNINIVSLANNHVFDLGIDGFINTIKLLNKSGIAYCGAGLNLEEASRPVFIKLKGKRIAVFSYCQYGTPHIGYVPIASVNTPGVNPFEIRTAISDIKKAKQKYDYVFVCPHWGIEYTSFPTGECKKIAYELLDAGADGIFGGHSHQIQPHITYKNKPVFFSLGNFIFADFYIRPPRPIWYPDRRLENNAIKITYDYPYPVTEPLKRVWREFSRIGMIADIRISNKIKATYRLSYLTIENKVEFMKKTASLINKLRIIGFMIKMPLYAGGKYYFRLKRFINILTKIRKPMLLT